MVEKKSWYRRLLDAEPVVVRGFIVTALGAVATIVNFQLSEAKVEATIDVVIAVLALASALWSRGSVTPNMKVIKYKPAPEQKHGAILSGPADDGGSE